MANTLGKVVLLLAICTLIASKGCMDKAPMLKRSNPSSWVINDAALTSKLHEIARQSFAEINDLDTTLYEISLMGTPESYFLLFVEKTKVRQPGIVYCGYSYAIKYRRDDWNTLELLKSQ
jgi:hypothetical protein